MNINMKKTISLILAVILTNLFATLPGTALEQPEISTSEIDYTVLPEYVEGNSLSELGYTQRLTKYDTEDTLNIVGFSTSTGNEAVAIYPYDVKYIENNQLIDKDPTLMEASEALQKKGYAYTNAANDIKILLPEKLNETPSLIELNNNSISVMPEINNPDIDYVKTEKSLEYNDVMGEDTNLTLASDYSGINMEISTENIIQNNTYIFDLDLEGYISVVSDNSIVFEDKKTGEAELMIPQVLAENDEGLVLGVELSISQKDSSESGYTLSAVVDTSDINDSITVPSVYTLTMSISQINYSAIQDSPVYSNFPNSNLGDFTSTVIGTKSPYGVGRYYVKFDLSSLSNIKYDRVISAYYEMPKVGIGSKSEIEAYIVNETWDENTITWNNKPNYYSECLGMTLYDQDDGSIGDYIDASTGKSHFYITSAVQAWLQGVSNYGIMLKEREDRNSVAYATRDAGANNPVCLYVVYASDDGVSSRGVTDDTYYIKGKINNMFMTVASDSNNASVTQETLRTNRENQLWKLEKQSDGYYIISPACSTTRCLQATSNISIGTNTNLSTQRWMVRRNWDGSYSLLSKSDISKNVSVGVNYYTAGYSLIYGTDSMSLRKYDDWTLIPNEKGTASVFGFSGNDWVGIDTEGFANATRIKLTGAALNYNANTNDGTDKTAATTLSEMPGSRIFCYYGHGNTGLLAFVSSDNGSTYLTGSLIPYCSGESTVESLAANVLRNQTLTFYDACLAGRTMDSSSLVGMAYYRGSHYVVSFLNETTNDMSGFVVEGRNDNNVVINGFYDKLASGMTVYQALTALDNEVYDYYDGTQQDPFVETFRYRNCIGDNSLIYNISEYSVN